VSARFVRQAMRDLIQDTRYLPAHRETKVGPVAALRCE